MPADDVMTVKEIIAKYMAANLAAHGFDGLVNLDIECGCKACDLAPCGEMLMDCVGGHVLTEQEARDRGTEPEDYGWEFTVVVGPRPQNDGKETTNAR